MLRGGRFIPACAGNRRLSDTRRAGFAVHPRVCGEQALHPYFWALIAGSSPRVRGTGQEPQINQPGGRFIPACAGNRSTAVSQSFISSVHPRVCGEQGDGNGRAGLDRGSSPRVRGTELAAGQRIGDIRFIPACAGNRWSAIHHTLANAVHPRVCGEQLIWITVKSENIGSSPRVRGTVALVRCRTRYSRFIPACAGNSSSMQRIDSKNIHLSKNATKFSGSIVTLRNDLLYTNFQRLALPPRLASA